MGKRTRISVDQRLEVDNNIFIRYADLGPRSADNVVLLLHGLMVTADNQWGTGSGVCDALLDAGYRCILPDLRGHGGSSKPYDPSKYGLCVVKDLVKLLDHLKLEKVHVLGYSAGAEISIFFTIHNQERAKSLCIGGSGWADAEQANVYKSMGKCCSSLPGLPCGINLVCWSRVVWYPCCCPLCFHCAAGFVPNMKATIIFAKAHGEQLLDLPEEKVKSIRVPFLGAEGEKDDEFKYMKRLEGVVEQFEFVTFAGLGHEQAGACEEWKETILKFLDKQEKTEGEKGRDAAKSSAPEQEEMYVPGAPKSQQD